MRSPVVVNVRQDFCPVRSRIPASIRRRATHLASGCSVTWTSATLPAPSRRQTPQVSRVSRTTEPEGSRWLKPSRTSRTRPCGSRSRPPRYRFRSVAAGASPAIRYQPAGKGSFSPVSLSPLRASLVSIRGSSAHPFDHDGSLGLAPHRADEPVTELARSHQLHERLVFVLLP